MKNTNLKRLVLFAVVFVAFLIASPLRIPLQVFLAERLSFSLVITGFVEYAAFLACLLLVVMPCKGAAVFKAIAATVVFWVVDRISSLLKINLTAALIWDMIRPVVIIGIFLLAFRWITKRRILPHKPLLLLSCGTFAVSTVANILKLLYTNAVMQSLQDLGSGLSTYFRILTLSNNGFHTVVVACGHLLLFLIALLALRSREDKIPEQAPTA